jgi:RNA-splicing ligase RtcB
VLRVGKSIFQSARHHWAYEPKSTARHADYFMRRIVYPEHLLRQLVEESPAAYRDIGEVLDDQEDLVRRRVRLEPIAVLKG